MDETIGAKGGRRDRKRTIIISQNKKKKLIEDLEEKQLHELEKKVKKQQIYTLIKAFPIVLGGGVAKTIYDTSSGKRKMDKEEENSAWRIKEYDADITSKTQSEFEMEQRRKIITTSDGQKIVVYVSHDLPYDNKSSKSNDTDNKADNANDLNIDQNNDESNDIRDNRGNIEDRKLSFDGHKKNSNSDVVRKPKGIYTDNAIRDSNNIDGNIQSYNDYDYSDDEFSNLPSDIQNKIQQLKSRKIVDEYEKQLKDIRYDLRNIIYEYNVLVDEEDRAILSKEAEQILDRLSDIISRIEVLKSKIRIEDLDKYDDNYIYVLIEGYLREFRDGKIISEIKDSPLYVMISEKLDELDDKRGNLEKKVSAKKEMLDEKEESFEEMKKRYYSIDKLNRELLDFQNSQDKMLEEIRRKIDNATSETERVEYQFQGMNRMTRRMLRMLSFQLFLPGPRFARGMAASAAANLYFLNNIIRPRTTTKRYRVITVKDYSSDIENNIDRISDSINLLGKTSKQIDIMIAEINDKYKDYFGVIKECDEMIMNLYKMKSELEEKEYEMERLKKQQELELERNNAKVKTIGEYPVN